MKQNLLLLLIVLLINGFKSIAQGDLLVTPIRVVFEGNKQKEALNLVNTGKDTATYSISFLQYNMKEDGSFVNIEKPDSGQLFANPYLRIFPRQVTLAPGEPQVIMLQCRRKADMLAGEYRSHLYFRAEKNYKPLGTKNSGKDTTLLSVQLIPVYGMSIPVIIRSGVVNASTTLSNIKLETQQDTVNYLSLTLNRSGNSSVYGNLTIDYFPVKGKPYEIGQVKGVGVYTNTNKRNILIRLNKTPGQVYKDGKLKVRYTSPDEAKYMLYAEGELDIRQ
jgi:hypothetical protein